MQDFNLVPWRGEKQQRMQIQTSLALVSLLIFCCVFLSFYQTHLKHEIAKIRQSNLILKQELNILTKQHAEILRLSKEERALKANLEIIEKHRKSNDQILSVLAEVSVFAPSSIQLSSLEISDNQIQLRGSSQTEASLGNFIQNFNCSQYLKQPEILNMKLTEDKKTTFTLASFFNVNPIKNQENL
ncbi:MAG: PilN domain-containing protein [Gammaproteobacteria bacterium]